VRDCTGGYRCTRTSAWKVIDLNLLQSRGYGFQLELNRAWARGGMRFAELPIVFRDRVSGASKMSASILFEALWVVLRLRLGLIPSALKSSRERWPSSVR
jgi:dolichol-phosphate mannosyltransferase